MAHPRLADPFKIAPRPRGRSFADDLQLRRGDTAVLGRFVLAAERAFEDLGLQAHRVPIEGLRAAVDANPKSWRNVAPAFDARQTTVDPENLAIVVLADQSGTVRAASAKRFYDLGTTSLKAAIEDNSFMYGAHPAGDRSRVVFDVSAPAAAAITGRVTLLGGLWVHPDQRGSGITVLITDLMRAYALGTWDFDTEVLVGRDGLVRPHVLDQYGFARSQRGYRHRVDGELVYDGHLISTPATVLAARLAALVDQDAIGRQRAETA
jgi:hypothetical protein